MKEQGKGNPAGAEDQKPEIVPFAELPEMNLDKIPVRPVARLKLGKRHFAIHSLMDVPTGEVQAMLAEEERLRQKPGTWRSQLTLARKQIRLVAPDVTDKDLDALTAREIATLSGRLFAGLGMPQAKE